MKYKYPYNGTSVTFREAKEFIARVIYPDETSASARNKVGVRIKRALANGDLPSDALLSREQETFDADKLFRWAKNVDSWEALREVEGVPWKPHAWDGRGCIEAVVDVAGKGAMMPGAVNNDHSKAKERYWEDQEKIPGLKAFSSREATRDGWRRTGFRSLGRSQSWCATFCCQPIADSRPPLQCRHGALPEPVRGEMPPDPL